MEKEKVSGPTDHDDRFGIKWDAVESALDKRETEITSETSDEPGGGELPVEPGPETRPEDDSATTTPAALSNFFNYGTRGESTGLAGPLFPALLYRYKDLSNFRHECPLCFVDKPDGMPAKPLTQIFDDLIDATAAEGDEGERIKHHILQVESGVKALVANKSTGAAQLADMWDETSELLLSECKNDEQKILLQGDLDAARSALDTNGAVIPCGTDSSLRLFEASVRLFWSKHTHGWLEELEGIICGLDNILIADYQHSGLAKSPERLRESSAAIGDGELDFDVMSKILSDSHKGAPVPQDRLDRIRQLIDTIRQMKQVFSGIAQTPGETDTSLDTSIVVNDCAAATERYRSNMNTMAEFFKAVRIGRLEAASKYDPDKHDQIFADFDPTTLTEKELALCPPLLVKIDGNSFTDKNKAALLDLLDSGIPAKVLVEVDDLHGRTSENFAAAPVWPNRLANIAMALGNVYVLQSTVSQPSYFQNGVLEGLSYGGPALFNVFTGNTPKHLPLTPYLVAAAAGESRAFPSFTFNPGNGETLSDCFDISDNPHSECLWSVDRFDYRSGDTGEHGGPVSVELPFTPADLFLAVSRFENQFWPVPPSEWHDDMIPLGEYLAADARNSEGKIPYVTGVSVDGTVVRVVITMCMLSVVKRTAKSWRYLQELGGINNSHAIAALEAEKGRLEEEKRQEIEDLEKKYSSELDRDIGDLSEEIIRRIASQLVTGSASAAGPAFPLSTPAPSGAASVPSAPPSGEAEAGAAVQEEEEEALSFDEPYIDTPLCTSCNECTNLNKLLFAYNENKQATIKDASAGTFKDLVTAAEKCPVHIIHPGKPKNPDEPGLEDLIARAARFN